MTLKKYQNIKLALVVIIAFVFSQTFYYQNYILPVGILVASSLLLLLLRKKVTDVLADERDYSMGGKAALLAIQIYAWLAVVAMFVFNAKKDLNPAFEPIAMTLAFSTLFLMLFYALIFRFYNKFSLADKKIWYLVFVIALFAVILIASLKFSGGDIM